MPRYNKDKIIEAHNVEAIKDNKSRIGYDFHILRMVLFAAGLTFPPFNHKKSRNNHVFPKFLEVVMNFMACFLIVINTFFWQRRYSSVALHFSTTLTIFLALAIRFVLLLSRRQIPRMVKNLIQLYDDIALRIFYKSLKNIVLVGCFMTFLLTAMASVIDGYHLMVDKAKGEHSIQFLIEFNDADGRYQKLMFRLFMFLVPIKMYFAYGVSVIILIFCCSVYTVAKRTIEALHNRIRRYSNRGSHSASHTNNVLCLYLVYYNRISQCVAEIDEVLSPCVLLLYGLMVSAQFYTLSLLISKDAAATSITMGFHNVIVFLLTTIAFLVITLTASKVTEVSEDVKRLMGMLSEDVAKGDNTAVERSTTCLLLASILSGSHLTFTGWKMFNINRSFILTTMGVMISYGVIVVQIGPKYDDN